ncbi:hypothetical protein GCM10020367_52740 [Streptomyces sannanensis]|uniref:DUF4111 domain-containing protein n=1 Tax=Streptomyces sannanensis TaxID=285536 RepID=A0ABP6SHY5_9ACTN
MSLPPEVRQTTSTFLAAIDASAPGLVEGLYLCGSLGFGEFFPERSDVDFVAVLAERPDRAALEALAEAHEIVRREHPRPFFDGFHAVRDDLAKPPEQCPDLPCTQAGVFKGAGRFSVNPVTWHELVRHGVKVRGPVLTESEVWTDDAALRAFSHGNLSSYWSGVHEALVKSPEEAGDPDAAEWCVLSVSRLHHLLATGSLTSKSGAGRYALAAFESRWHSIILEALRVRESTGASSAYDGVPGHRASDTIAFTAMVVEAGLALGVTRG